MPASERVRGMTLVELAATLAIVGVLSSLAVVSYQAFNQNEKGVVALKSIQAQLTKARQLAVARNQPVRITITTPVTVGTATFSAVRWEALPCAANDAWGNNCPSAACNNTPCGGGGCVCDPTTGGEVGPMGTPSPGLMVPTNIGVTLPPLLNGLCFLGGSGLPVLRAANDCAVGNPPPTSISFPFVMNDGRRAFFEVEPTTGLVHLMDCSSMGAISPPCP